MREIKFRAWNEVKERMEYDVYKEWHNLMQYTGLKDCNGKEIYESDVVTGTYEAFNAYCQEYETISFTSDVQWTNTGFGVKRKTFNDEGRLRDYGYQLVWDADGVEVIGNVFENPNWESESHEVD